MHDPSAASKETTDEKRQLPLHIACRADKEHVDTVKVLYDGYPEAIWTCDGNGKAPIFMARASAKRNRRRISIVVDFLQLQLEYARRTQDSTIMTTLDENGWLPLHCALKNNVTLGSIKLLLRGTSRLCGQLIASWHSHFILLVSSARSKLFSTW